MHIRIVTRRSKLALWQTNYIVGLLKKAGISSEIIALETLGDKILDVTIAKIGSKGVFTEELEKALLSGQADIAIHSAKDMQSTLPEPFELIAYTERERANDVLIGQNKNISLEDDVTVGTSSTRRMAFIKHYFPNIRTIPVRGNLQTRIKKMESGLCDALMLAYAGVHRMDYDAMIISELDIATFTPPVGQGCIAVEATTMLDEDKKIAIRNAVNDVQTELCLLAERAFLKKLEGGCSIPAFGHAQLKNNKLEMEAGIVSLNGQTLIRKVASGNPDDSESIGTALATEVLEAGGKEILAQIKNQ